MQIKTVPINRRIQIFVIEALAWRFKGGLFWSIKPVNGEGLSVVLPSTDELRLLKAAVMGFIKTI